MKICRLFRNDVGVKNVLVELFCDFCEGSTFCCDLPSSWFFSLSLKGAVVKEQVFLNSSLPPKMDYTYLSRNTVFLSNWYKAAMWVGLVFFLLYCIAFHVIR